jgi:hypothetical protein
MAFVKKEGSIDTPKKSVEDFFKPIKHQKVALKIALYARAKKGKTHFAITAAKYLSDHKLPGYLYVVDTEGDFHVNASTWPQEVQDKIRLFNAVEFLDKKEKKVDLVKSLTLLEEAIDTLTDMVVANEEKPEADREYGFICIDSGSDCWEWLTMWIETIQTKKNPDGSMMQTEWGKANKKYMDLIRMILSTNWNLILTFRAHQAFDGPTPLKYDLPRWQKNTDFWFNCIMELKKVGDEHWFYFRGGRFGNLPENDPLKNATWEDVKNKVASYSSLEFV